MEGQKRRKQLTSRTKRVPDRKLPHARQKLREPTTEKCHTDDEVGSSGGRAMGVAIIEREDESRGREGEEATIRRV